MVEIVEGLVYPCSVCSLTRDRSQEGFRDVDSPNGATCPASGTKDSVQQPKVPFG